MPDNSMRRAQFPPTVSTVPFTASPSPARKAFKIPEPINRPSIDPLLHFYALVVQATTTTIRQCQTGLRLDSGSEQPSSPSSSPGYEWNTLGKPESLHRRAGPSIQLRTCQACQATFPPSPFPPPPSPQSPLSRHRRRSLPKAGVLPIGYPRVLCAFRFTEQE